jgi:hypothetical protein
LQVYREGIAAVAKGCEERATLGFEPESRWDSRIIP